MGEEKGPAAEKPGTSNESDINANNLIVNNLIDYNQRAGCAIPPVAAPRVAPTLLCWFSPSASMIAVAAIQRTDEGLMLARVKVFVSADLAWIEEYPECEAHRPIACVEFWLDQSTGSWANRQKEAGHQLSFRFEYIDKLA